MVAIRHVLASILFFIAYLSNAAVLPEEKLDIMYHSYDGGGSDIKGPSVLVRKQFSDKISTWGSYYADSISSASIDVVTQASAYSEDHVQYNAGADYLYGRTLLSVNGAKSIQDDYDGSAFGFGISQEFFGDLSTISMNYNQGNDVVKQNGNENFEEDKYTQRFAVNFTQILTRNWIAAINTETILEEGYLSNPYRGNRYRSADAFAFEAENYPRTRNSDAISFKSLHFLPYRAALKLEYRYFQDNWDIEAKNFEIKYVHPWKDKWIFEAKLRQYRQNAAYFYNDLFDVREQFEFRARDKELSTYTTKTFGVGVSYETDFKPFSFVDKTSVNFAFDFMQFDYEDFRDARQRDNFDAGEEPLYSFDANVLRLWLSMWY